MGRQRLFYPGTVCGVVLVFCHLFIGTVLGLFLYQATGKRLLVGACALGAILPDLIDKPLGHLILKNSLDYGRIFAHSLLFITVLVILALVLWKARSSLLLGAVAAGVGTHLILDNMWDLPVSLFYPLLGPFEQGHFPDYFGSSMVTELSSPLEWLFGLVVLMIFLDLYYDRFGGSLLGAKAVLDKLLKPCLVLILALGALYIITAPVTSSDWVGMETSLTLGLSAVLGAVALLAPARRSVALQKSAT